MITEQELELMGHVALNQQETYQAEYAGEQVPREHGIDTMRLIEEIRAMRYKLVDIFQSVQPLLPCV